MKQDSLSFLKDRFPQNCLHKENLYWVPWVGPDQVVHLYNPAYEFFVFPLLSFSPKPQLKKYFQFWQTTFFVTCSVYFQFCWPGCIEVTVESMDGVILNPTTKAFKFTLGEGRSWLWWKKLLDILNKQVLVTNTMVMIQNDFGKPHHFAFSVEMPIVPSISWCWSNIISGLLMMIIWWTHL